VLYSKYYALDGMHIEFSVELNCINSVCLFKEPIENGIFVLDSHQWKE